MSKIDSSKKFYRVSLREHGDGMLTLAYDCLATDADDAVSQAEKAHPGFKAVHETELEDAGYVLVIYSPNESAMSDDSAGFWSNEYGWTTFGNASLFKPHEMKTQRLPLALGDDACWVVKDQAQISYGESA